MKIKASQLRPGMIIKIINNGKYTCNLYNINEDMQVEMEQPYVIIQDIFTTDFGECDYASKYKIQLRFKQFEVDTTPNREYWTWDTRDLMIISLIISLGYEMRTSFAREKGQ